MAEVDYAKAVDVVITPHDYECPECGPSWDGFGTLDACLIDPPDFITDEEMASYDGDDDNWVLRCRECGWTE